MHSNGFTASGGAKNSPSFSFVEDPLTGLYLVSAGVIGIVSNGVEVGRLTANGGLVLSAGAGLGGAVTQATDKSTGVTLNKMMGQVTMNGASLAGAAEVAHTVTNSLVAPQDVVVACIVSGATAATYTITVDAVGSGSFRVTIGNYGSTLSEAIVYNFMVFKGATN